MTFYDMHSHILPGVDDGCKTADDSLRLINKHIKNGVTNICLTPHFYTHHKSVEDFLSVRREAYRALLNAVPEGVNLCLGAEVYVTSYLFNNKDISSLCYGNSNYMLTEFPYTAGFEGKSMDMLVRLMGNYGITPVIPHIERYEKVFNDYDKLWELKEMGVLIQTNASSLQGFLRKNHILRLIDKGIIDLLGTDAHSVEKGNPDTLPAACNLIEKKCGRRALRRILQKSEEIFNKTN